MEFIGYVSHYFSEHTLLASALMLSALIIEGEITLIVLGVFARVHILSIELALSISIVGALLKTFLGYMIGQMIKKYIPKNKIFDFIKPQIQIKLLTNFNINNLINNSLNLGSLKKFRQNNFSIKSNSSLHSKIYIFDRKEVVVSSANLTFGGLVKNHEYGFYSKNPIINQKIIDDYCEIFDHENSFEINEENLENAEKIIKSSEFNNRNLNNLIIDSDIIPHLKGWKKELFDIVNKFDSYEFSIDQVYQFRDHFRNLFPLNNYIDDKIRQTLQFLRNDGLIDFLSHGNYRKNWQTLN